MVARKWLQRDEYRSPYRDNSLQNKTAETTRAIDGKTYMPENRLDIVMGETGQWSAMQMQVLRCCPKEGRRRSPRHGIWRQGGYLGGRQRKVAVD
jgi:hypothetical protein